MSLLSGINLAIEQANSHVPYPRPCTDCGARVGESCVEGCPNLDGESS